MQPLESVAVSALIALFAGLVMPSALNVDLNRGLLVWIVAVVASGVVLGTSTSASAKSILKTAGFPSVVFSGTIAGFLVVRWLFSWIQHPNATAIVIPVGSAAFADPFVVLIGLIALGAIGSLASYITIVIAAIAAHPLLSAATHLYRFGPNGMITLRRIILAAVGIVMECVQCATQYLKLVQQMA